MSYQERALAIIDRLTDSKAINIRERGTLRRAILLPKRPQGEWVVNSNGTTNYYACNQCGNAGDIQDKFCRECGADMRGAK